MSENPPLPSSPLPVPVAALGATAPTSPTAVVGIGGSAGAVDSYERFFLGIPPVSGLCFVVVPQLDARHGGLMREILERCTTMPVVQIEDGLPLQADHVYVAAPGRGVTLSGGALHFGGVDEASGPVIDGFLASLAQDQGAQAIAVVLSGLEGGGAQGLRAIRAHGGRVLIEAPGTAEYPELPQSAADAVLADEVLPVEDLAARLMDFSAVTRQLDADELTQGGGPSGAPLQRILRLIRSQTGHDFTRYKRATLLRRIDRHMKSRAVQDITAYLKFLEDSPAEVEALFQDFTINVTSFFRDIEAFEALKTHLRASVVARKQAQDTIRVWVTACSTGEEAYSVAIVLNELLEEVRAEQRLQVQIFATDIDQAAIKLARQGRYSKDIAYVVSPERLARYFSLQDGHYTVRAEIRELVVFATHSTFGDPPFTRLDLLCCRNMLIYIGAELQNQLLDTFLFALRPDGLLFLGASESVGQHREQFTPLDARWKIFRRGERSTHLPPMRAFSQAGESGTVPGIPAMRPHPATDDRGSDRGGDRGSNLGRQVQRTLLADHAPPAVLIDEHGNVLYVHGRTARYLELPSGHPPHTVFELVPPTLRRRLQMAVQDVLAGGPEQLLRDVHLESGGIWQTIDVRVKPLGAAGSGPLLITFHERPESPVELTPAAPAGAGSAEQIAALELALSDGRDMLQATVEEMAISVEELRSSNEELQTTNEELQSTNEELTTSKEELQSLNEELHTVNAEHLTIIQAQAQANDDIRNLLDNAGIATVFLSRDLKIRRFTLPISPIIPLTPTDLGRPLADLSVRLRYTGLMRDLKHVLDTLEPLEVQVQTQRGEWYLMRVSPYRTHDNAIDGVVVAFTNIQLIRSPE